MHREQLIERVWPGQFRTDDVVTKAVQELRRALAQTPDQLVIETIPRVGYWLRLPFAWIDDSRSDVHVASAEAPADSPTEPRAVDIAPQPPLSRSAEPAAPRRLPLLARC
ncbi:MAG: winged helix-turn-helix domain-containing protein [Rhodanobacteraceae bacterium]|nr:winged helix-turn-helix domain-containing protein [Rhodanobacteraceae bacterium]